MKTVAVVDYGMGNLGSVVRAVEECGGNPLILQEPGDLGGADCIILPGVGAFADGIRNIRARGFEQALADKVVHQGVPFLGICLGMQLLATKGMEGGETNGLGWIEGDVRRLEPDGVDVRIPHVGWNEVVFAQDSPLFSDMASNKDFYFVHSYHFVCTDAKAVLARTPYCGGFNSVVGRENIFGVQFHPEKSQRVGFQLLRNFLTL